MNKERIITAAVITTGEKSDGKQLQALIEKSRETGIEIDIVRLGIRLIQKRIIFSMRTKTNYN